MNNVFLEGESGSHNALTRCELVDQLFTIFVCHVHNEVLYNTGFRLIYLVDYNKSNYGSVN